MDSQAGSDRNDLPPDPHIFGVESNILQKWISPVKISLEFNIPSVMVRFLIQIANFTRN